MSVSLHWSSVASVKISPNLNVVGSCLRVVSDLTDLSPKHSAISVSLSLVIDLPVLYITSKVSLIRSSLVFLRAGKSVTTLFES